MIFYILYELGKFIATLLPRRANYMLADSISYFYWLYAKKDRGVIRRNLKVVFEGSDIIDYDACSRGIFKNFSRYLADFFRFSKVDKAFVEENVAIEGEESLRAGAALGRGVILLSAHIGNWELGGMVVSLLGYPLHAVALAHKNRSVDSFFVRQRSFGGVKVISLGPDLKRCFRVLRSNGFIALLGDRGFSENGIVVDFFGRPARMPVGPAVFALKTGAAIVPVFLVREDNMKFKFIMDEPILPVKTGSFDESVRLLISKYLAVTQEIIRRYPAQWYMFRDVWNTGL